MKFKQLIILTSTLFLSVSCASKTAINQPVSATASPVPSAAIVAPTASPISAPKTVTRSGTFVAGEAPTEGTAQIVTENGNSYLELDPSFKTSNQGPDLVVILHRSDDVLGSTEPPTYPLQAQDYVVLSPLQAFSGAQRYPIPEDINLDDYKSAVIWCRQFNATFGVATFDR